MLSAIIVNYRSSDLVDACLRSLYAGSARPDESVVIDNQAEGWEPPGDLRGRDGIRVISRRDNPGYSASCNSGASAAAGGELLFLNADVRLGHDCLERTQEALHAAPDVGIVSPRLIRPDGSLDHACHRGLPTPLAALAYKSRLSRLAPRSRRLSRYTMSWLDPLTEHDVEACTGAFMLMPRSVLDGVGGWDERYRFYAEDLDLCVRVAEAGRRVRYVGTTTAIHMKGAFSHQHVPDSQLDPEQRATKRRVQGDIAAAHRLFYDEHLAPGAGPVARGAMRSFFFIEGIGQGIARRRTRS